MENFVSINSFKFNSLHKYMTPIYAELNHKCHAPDDLKRTILAESITAFFIRMREYRGLSLQELSEKTNISTNELEAFEQGKKKDRHIEAAYARALGGEAEVGFFLQLLHEFKTPSIKESKLELARAALRQYGVMVPGVDYQRLSSETGIVIPMHRTTS